MKKFYVVLIVALMLVSWNSVFAQLDGVSIDLYVYHDYNANYVQDRSEGNVYRGWVLQEWKDPINGECVRQDTNKVFQQFDDDNTSGLFLKNNVCYWLTVVDKDYEFAQPDLVWLRDDEYHREEVYLPGQFNYYRLPIIGK